MANIYESIKYFKGADGVEIEYADLGGDGPTLLFIPGYSLATDLVLPALSKLHGQFRVITLTLRGFGGANPSKAKGTPAEGEVSLSQAARDVKALIDYLNLDECIVMGYSMGTHVAFSYIEQFGCDRISKLIILDMTPKLINDETWNLGLYQGHYTTERALYDLNIMKDNFNNKSKEVKDMKLVLSSVISEIDNYLATFEFEFKKGSKQYTFFDNHITISRALNDERVSEDMLASVIYHENLHQDFHKAPT